MKNKTNIIVVCNSKKEYMDCYEKLFILYNTKLDKYYMKMIDEELKIYQLPIFLMIEDDLNDMNNISVDWCIDKECVGCACLSQCSTHKRISSKDFMTNFRTKKLERILNV